MKKRDLARLTAVPLIAVVAMEFRTFDSPHLPQEELSGSELVLSASEFSVTASFSGARIPLKQWAPGGFR
jgi:hypothetical protein